MVIPIVTSGGTARSGSFAAAIRWIVRRGGGGIAGLRFHVLVEGIDQVPAHGPVVFAARHYHHLWDGFVLLGAIPRPIHFLVALDWVPWHPLRTIMEAATTTLQWPPIIRTDGIASMGGSAYGSEESGRYLRHSLREMLQLLRAGEALVIFPEAYPNIDPVFTRKRSLDEHLPFHDGFLRIIARAQKRGSGPVAIVPTGLSYSMGERRVVVRFGAPVHLSPGDEPQALLLRIEAAVRELSG